MGAIVRSVLLSAPIDRGLRIYAAAVAMPSLLAASLLSPLFASNLRHLLQPPAARRNPATPSRHIRHRESLVHHHRSHTR